MGLGTRCVGELASRPHCARWVNNLTTTREESFSQARANICACPTTERDLGDGLAPLGPLRSAGATICVGIDSHIITDQLEELRALETHERLRLRRRVTFEPAPGRTPAEQLVLDASVNGAAAIGFVSAALPSSLVPLDQRVLSLTEDNYALDAVVFGGAGARVIADFAAKNR